MNSSERRIFVEKVVLASRAYLFAGASDFKYATTASASSRLKRYCGMGGLPGRSLYAMPVIRNFTAASSYAVSEDSSAKNLDRFTISHMGILGRNNGVGKLQYEQST